MIDKNLVKVMGLCKSFESKGGKLEILKDLDIELNQGDSVAVVGASGIGKSTLLHILGTLDHPDSGKILFQGRDIFSLGHEELAKFRNQTIGFVFQFHHLLPEFTALENAMMPGLIQGLDKKHAEHYAERFLSRVGLKHRLSHRVTELSGGEQQRVAIARALVLKPMLLLADEPTGNLDKKNSAQVHELLNELNKEFNMTSVVVTHNLELAAYMSRKVTLKDGKLAETE